MRVIAIGDIHLKAAAALEAAGRAIDALDADAVVLLGDYCDDWGATLERELACIDEVARWTYDVRERGIEVHCLMGNHDAAYLGGEQCSGMIEQGATDIRRALARLPLEVAVAIDGALYTHAGLCLRWAAENIPSIERDADAIARALNDLARTDRGMRWLSTVGWARGGWDFPGPLWADLRELAADPVPGLVQVVGHTPVPSVTDPVCGRGALVIACDTLSLDRAGSPIGDGSLALVEDGEWGRAVSRAKLGLGEWVGRV